MTEEQREAIAEIAAECRNAPGKADQPIAGVIIVDRDFLTDIAQRLLALLADDVLEADIAALRKP